jgi:acyl-CoA thioester hydrolase
VSTASSSGARPEIAAGGPLPLIEASIEARRTNALGHLRAAEYVVLFDDAIMAMFPRLELTDASLLYEGTSPFLMDLHATYLRELRAGARVAISAQVLDVDQRRVRLILLMHEAAGGSACATCELAIINMDLAARRPVPWSAAQAATWTALRVAHAGLPVPAQAGRAIGPLARP